MLEPVYIVKEKRKKKKRKKEREKRGGTSTCKISAKMDKLILVMCCILIGNSAF